MSYDLQQTISPRPEDFVAEPPRLSKLPKDVSMQVAGRVAVGLNAICSGQGSGHLGVVTYHRVANHVTGLPAPIHNVTPCRFQQHLTGLLDRGFQFWTLNQALKHRKSGDPFPERTAVVTFDDGFQSVYTEAWPILQELNIPATVFLNTAYLDWESPFPFDAWGVAYQHLAPSDSCRPLTIEQCHEMTDDGLIDFGAHTHTHTDHRGQPNSFREDLQKSVDIVRSVFRLDDVTFAFPYGGRYNGFASDELVRQARRTGVTCALTTDPVLVQPDDDPFTWGRFNAFPWDTGRSLAAKLSGWYSWAPRLNRRLARLVRGH